MSANRKFYEALATRTMIVEETVVEDVVDDMVDHPMLSAVIAWAAFATPTCKVCGNPTSARVLDNFGGVCGRCHRQHRWS